MPSQQLGKDQVELDTAETGVVEVEVIGADFIAEIGLAVAIVLVDRIDSLA